MAARGQQVERLRLMLDHGAPVDLSTRSRTTVLHGFAKMNRKAKIRRDLLQILVDHGADLSARDIYDATPLAAAISEGSLEDIAHFLAVGAKVTELELRWAADRPERFAHILPHAPEDAREQIKPWLETEIARLNDLPLEASLRESRALFL